MPLFTPESLAVVLAIGLSTHLLAGTVALTQTDIKRVLAYSTLSQLGLMMTALSLGAVSAAMFHLFTHAYFKALLFLAAGSIIHATHSQELSGLGGLSKAMPWTRGLFLIAALSMGGFPLLSGFWSKDAVLLAAREHAPVVMWALLAGAVMTAGYVFRVYLRVFHGACAEQGAGGRGHGHRASPVPHESPAIMVVPMAVLGLGAAIAGLAGSPLGHSALFRLLGDHYAHEGIDMPILILSSLALAAGFSLAYVVGFQRKRLLPEPLRPLGRGLYAVAFHKYYADALYQAAIIRPFLASTRWLSRFDQQVIDGAVNGAGWLGWRIGQLKEWADRVLVDGFVNGVAAGARAGGASLRLIQNGLVHRYLLVVVGSVVVLAFLLQRAIVP
jgi:NADH-quinone oxidoreductase subunit L